MVRYIYIYILFYRCSQNCKGKINASEKFVLLGTCAGDACDSEDDACDNVNICNDKTDFEWLVYIANKPLERKQNIDWHIDEQVIKHVEQYRRRSILVVKRFTLVPGNLYRFILFGRKSGDNKGLAMWYGMTDTPPVNGTCGTYTPVGVAMITEFTFWCDGWIDEDLPLYYEVVYFNKNIYINGEKAETLFSFGMDNSSSGVLPIGDEDNNYMLPIEIRVIDTYGSIAKVMLTIQVTMYIYSNKNIYLITGNKVPLYFPDMNWR